MPRLRRSELQAAGPHRPVRPVSKASSEVIVTPDVKVVDLVPDDWAYVVASDGVYDVLSDQDASF